MPEDNSSEMHEKDQFTPEEIQSLEAPSYLRRKSGPKPTAESIASYVARQKEKDIETNLEKLTHRLKTKLDEDSGGIASKLDPVNPNNENSDPTVPYVADPAKISNN